MGRRRRLNKKMGRGLLGGLLCGLLGGPLCGPWLAAAAWGEPSREPSPTPGLPLGQVLERLRADGIDTVYTSRLVTDALRVERFPDGDQAGADAVEDRLKGLLSPFGLTVKPMADGRWRVVVSRVGAVEGCVVSDPGGRALVGAEVRVDTTPPAARSGPDGCFRLSEISPGSRVLEVSKPGYLPHRLDMKVKAGQTRRLTIALVIDARAAEEIFVTTTLEEPPLGTLALRPTRLAEARRSDPDLLTAVQQLPGTLAEAGASFGVRGRSSERVTLVVDGMDIVEPYHFRHLGSLAGTVTPQAVAEARLHRGSPPVSFGNRAGGVLEVVTASPTEPFSGRLSATTESLQLGLLGASANGRARWMAAYRSGRPDIPREIAELDPKPRYGDGLLKVSSALGRRQDVALQALWARDDFSFRPAENYLLAADDPSPVLFAHQRSRHLALRHRLVWSDRHWVETLLSDARTDRRRFGYEHDYSELQPAPPGAYRLEDFRLSHRRALKVEGQSSTTRRLDLSWGLEANHERTGYDYAGFDLGGLERLVTELDQRHQGGFALATWRPLSRLTVETGLRLDRDLGPGARDVGTRAAPRATVSLRHGKSIWRLGSARVVSVPATHELRLGDGESELPGRETTDHLSLAWNRSGDNPSRAPNLSVELFSQWIEDPRPRFVNLFKPISRIPELEIDRLRLAPETSRMQGLEARAEWRWSGRRAGLSYQLSRSEDHLDGIWRPRRTDRRHVVDVWATFQLPHSINAGLRGSAATGRPTTHFDPEAFVRGGFAAALGPYHGERLPPEHRLDLRLSRQWRWKGARISAEAGIDNLYDRRPVRGFDLSALQHDAPAALAPELGLGRRFRWGLELAF